MPSGTAATLSDDPAARQSPPGRRERKKAATRARIEQVAWQLLNERGFDATTIEDIAAAADVAPRTFFRYFESKEAAVFGDWRADLEKWTRFVIDQPYGTPILSVLEEATVAFTDTCELQRDTILQRFSLHGGRPQLARFHSATIQPAWESELTDAVATRLGVDPSADLRPLLYAGLAIAAMNAAVRRWLDEGAEGSLSTLARDAFHAMGEITCRSTA